MTRLFFLVLIFTNSFKIFAQTDSLKKWKLSGIAVELYGITTRGLASNATQADFQKFNKSNDLINKDLTGYTTGYGTSYQTNFTGLFSAKAFFNLGKGKKFYREGFIGLRFGTTQLLVASYIKDTYDTTAMYVTPANNNFHVEVTDYTSSYFYQISAKRIFVPIGFNLTTNKTKRFWFTGGIELAPGISFDNTLSAYYNLNKSNLVLDQNSSYTNYSSYTRKIENNVEIEQSQSKIKGIGFQGYAAIPLSINFRFAKKINLLKHLNLSAQLSPALCYTTSKFATAQSVFAINASLGLRYNW